MLALPKDIDLRIVELLCSRLCHDLISPISAVNNGVELMNELGPDALDDTVTLIEQSGQQAANKLKCFRIAYGASGNETPLSDVRDTAIKYFYDSKTTLEWTKDSVAADKHGIGKVILNMILLAAETLAGVGAISVTGGSNEITVSTTGRTVPLRPDIEQALANHLDWRTIDPKAAHALATRYFAERIDADLSYIAVSPENYKFQLTW